jgi:spore coat protein A, manganese oxidase
MLVNGMIWPKTDVEPRHYRMRLLNGCDSRFLVTQFAAVNAGVTDPSVGTPLPFWVIGSDQGLGTPARTDTLVIEPGGRNDVVVDFSQVPPGSRVIMKNLRGDAPFGGAFGGDLAEEDLFPHQQTDCRRLGPRAWRGVAEPPAPLLRNAGVGTVLASDEI